jgi:hypothetical protein
MVRNGQGCRQNKADAPMALSERLFAAGLEQLSGTVVQIRNDAKSRLDRLEQQFANADETAQFNTNALGHALERIEIFVNQHALDHAETQRRTAQMEQRCDGLEEALARLQLGVCDEDISRRLAALEYATDEAAARLKRDDSRVRMAASLQAVMDRLESLEQAQANLQEEQRPQAPPGSPNSELPVPDFVEPPDSFFWSPTEARAGTSDHLIRTEPSFEEVFVRPEDAVENRFTRERPAAHGNSRRPQTRYFILIAGALFLVMTLAAGLVLSEHSKEPAAVRTAATAASAATPMQTYSLPEPADSDSETVFVVAPQAVAPPGRDAKNNLTPPSERGGPSHARLVELANSGNAVALTILGLRALDDAGAAPVNLPDAVRYLTQAAQKGQPVAQFRLGSMYEHAQGVATDLAKAAHWYETAANQGNRKAMHNLAVFYATGALGRKNMQEAARWFGKAAALGLRDSQFNLAFLYERGDGVPQSLVDAYKWYSAAAADGDKEAKARVRALEAQFNAADGAAAKKAAADFRATPPDRVSNANPVTSDL